MHGLTTSSLIKINIESNTCTNWIGANKVKERKEREKNQQSSSEARSQHDRHKWETKPKQVAMSSGGNLSCVLVAVDGSEESMNALRWALNNLKLRSPTLDSTGAPSFIIFHVQSPPSIATGLHPGAIPFGGPSSVHYITFSLFSHPNLHWVEVKHWSVLHFFDFSSGDIEVPAFTAAIEAHQKRITNAVLDHVLGICSEFNLTVRFAYSFFLLLLLHFIFLKSDFDSL